MLTLLLAALLVQGGVPTEAEGDAAARKLREDCAKLPIEGKIVALQEAAKIEHESVIKAIGEMLVKEADPVRIAAARALGEVDHPVSAEVLMAALAPNVKRDNVFKALLNAIAELGWQTPVPTLNGLLSKVADADTRDILPEVISTLGRLASISSIEPLIDLLLKLENGGRRNPWPNEGPMRRNGEDALRMITGVAEKGVAEWEAWWRANKDGIAAKATRIYWIRKTQDRVDVTPGEKAPADSVLVASRIHTPPAGTAQAPKKKKKSPK